MGPKRRHSRKFVQQLTRQGIHVGIKVTPNHVGLVAHIKVRQEEVEINAAHHGEEKRGPAVFKEIIHFKLFTSRNKIKQHRHYLRTDAQIIQPHGIGVFHEKVATQTVQKEGKYKTVLLCPANRGTADCGCNDNDWNKGRRDVPHAKHQARCYSNKEPIVILDNVDDQLFQKFNSLETTFDSYTSKATLTGANLLRHTS